MKTLNKKTAHKKRYVKKGYNIKSAHKGCHRNSGQKESKHWNWKGGKSFCVDCGKKVSARQTVRCKKCFDIYYRGKNHWNWKDGLSSLHQKIWNLAEYKQWRHKVLVRDNYTCLECREVGGKLNVHHIKALQKIIKENQIKNVWEAQMCKELWNVNNGITLCEGCHKNHKRS